MSSNSTIPLWINNEPIHTANTFHVTQASSNTTVHHSSSATSTEALQAIESSQSALQSWRKSSHVIRRDTILRVAEYYTANISTFIESQIQETSCTETWARTNVLGAVTYLKEIASQVSGVMGCIPPIEKEGTMGFVFKEPIGVILCIAPWNASLVLATRGIASAIAVGCTVVFKASELCPKTHNLITQAFTSSDLPPGVLNQIQTPRSSAAEVTETIIAHPAIRKVEFIGSAAVGRSIAQVASKYLKPLLLELGGKGPALILEDADLNEAAKQCALGAVLHHGQICFSTERIIVLESIFPQFRDLLIEVMKALGEKGVAGSAVSVDIANHAREVIRDAEENGAEVLIGGADDEPSGSTSLTPTVVLNPPPESRIYDEETFGPSVSLHTVKTDEEAIKLANASSYGLNATVWTKDMAHFMRISRELEYGQVHANSISVYTSATGSQGGVKGSGYGRQNGKWGLEEFVVEKFVSWSG